MSMRVCNVHGCPTLYEGASPKCKTHTKASDRRRGTASQRGYTSAGHQAFRAAVLNRDRTCVNCEEADATVADHYPMTRRELMQYGANPDDPDYGRGLCSTCHNKHTAASSPGGWADRG